MVESAPKRREPDRGREPELGRELAGERRVKKGTYRDGPPPKRAASEGPDVYLDVPILKVDEIHLDVENLEAHVSLDAAVLDLLRLNVGADVSLGKVNLEITGVEAQAILEVRLDNVADIVDRVLTTIDRNPEILQNIGRGLESAVRDVGGGAGRAVGDLGTGVAGAVEDVGAGAGGALEDVGKGAGGALEDVGKGVGGTVEDVGRGAGGALGDVGKGVGGAVEDVGEGAGGTVGEVGRGTGGAVRNAAGAAGEVGRGTGGAVQNAAGAAGETVRSVGESAPAAEGLARDAGGGTPRREREARRRPRAGHPAETEPAPRVGPDEGAETTALHGALRETEESVRELGRALLQAASKRTRTPARGPRRGEDRP
ncbi:hypothetical protein GCM10023191_072340 [Actinoallomurus oryzae]|uniref:Uncharacterized protein n=1 Tax=Actinoallomurus oryzae TaxID=502180 RepID=A0ABP8QU89_9ACTN